MADVVLVTGLSGFIARHVALAFLAKGYSVRGTARSAAKARKTVDSLVAKGARRDRIAVVEADLESDKGWTEAVAGVAGVLHLASPFPMENPKDRDALTPAAKGGALRVIDAALDAGVPRIILTSSMVAVMYRPNRPPEMTFTEKDWTDLSWPLLSAYVVSKTEAERAAWARVAERGAEARFTAINPGFVLGPALDKDFGTSIELIRLLMNGAYPAVPPVVFPVVDVRDLAAMHVAAFERPETGGRRLLASAGPMSLKEVARELRRTDHVAARRVPTLELPRALVGLMARFDPRLAGALQDIGCRPLVDAASVEALTGVKLRPPAEAVAATLKSLVAVGAL
ncbi:MAG: SDR family NAD(P)-dependent oxidoreductase [Parvularculaceae bacterium]|nr:SDR family NAD(P)-dependent oxidoreductase [Parvularculaceae bacterium]